MAPKNSPSSDSRALPNGSGKHVAHASMIFFFVDMGNNRRRVYVAWEIFVNEGCGRMWRVGKCEAKLELSRCGDRYNGWKKGLI